MKEKEKLLNKCIEKKIHGVSHLEIIELFDKNNVDKENRDYIFQKLEEFEKLDEAVVEEIKNTHSKKESFNFLLIGIGIIIFGFILMSTFKIGFIGVLACFLGSIYIFKGLSKIL